MSTAKSKIDEYHLLRQSRFPIVKRIELTQCLPEREGGSALRLTMELTTSDGDKGSMILTFDNVRQLRLLQSNWSVIQAPLLEIKDISSRQWENMVYEIVDREHGVFSFCCSDFVAKVLDSTTES